MDRIKNYVIYSFQTDFNSKYPSRRYTYCLVDSATMSTEEFVFLYSNEFYNPFGNITIHISNKEFTGGNSATISRLTYITQYDEDDIEKSDEFNREKSIANITLDTGPLEYGFSLDLNLDSELRKNLSENPLCYLSVKES